MAPQCCRCNGQGRCRSCKCSRSRVSCSNCAPGRNGRCENEVAVERNLPSSAAQSTSALLHSPSPERTTVSRLSVASPHNQPLAENLTRTPLPDQSDHLITVSIDNFDDSAPGSNVPIPTLDEPQVVLPSFTSVTEPTFSWGQVDANSFSHSLDASYAEIVH